MKILKSLPIPPKPTSTTLILAPPIQPKKIISKPTLKIHAIQPHIHIYATNLYLHMLQLLKKIL
jgi:hypothetical protein